MKRGDFHGRETVLLSNDFFQLECLVNGGPRVVRLIPSWFGENLFAELLDMVTPTPRGDYHFLGGHRLWTAPESLETTYIPDNEGATVTLIPNGIVLQGRVQPDVHLQKSITIEIGSSSPFAMLKHKIENRGRDVVRLALWALTMLRPGGIAILPQQYGVVDKDGLLPNRTYALWSYTRWDDQRLNLGDEYIRVHADDTRSPFKIGYFNPHGWLGYVFEDAFFIKRFGVRREETYPDGGCNVEVYTNGRMLELESLGGLADLKPGEEIVHTESWEVYRTHSIPKDLFGGKSLDEVLAG
jgi:hypothetical protein